MNYVNIDFNRQAGKIKPMHGVNNGPLTNMFACDASEYFRDAGIVYSRLHDTEYPFGSEKFVDIHCVFPDFNADAGDMNAYCFEYTDRYIKAIVDAGTKVFYRLGSSIEHQKIKKYIFPPPDFTKWAQICCGIIRHYNCGWANGFHYGIEYWEIWNEPENDVDENNPMWQGTKEQYFKLYETASKLIKSEFPGLKVGGYASCGVYAIDSAAPAPRMQYFVDFMHEFLAGIKENGAPLDFFSWHIYSGDINQYRRHLEYIAAVLEKYGFGGVEITLNEWNISGENMFKVMKTMRGAAHVAAVFSAMQKSRLDSAMYYDAQPKLDYCGLFAGTEPVTPCKALYSFKAWNILYRLGREVYSDSDNSSVYCCAATDGENGAVMLTNYGGDAAEITMTMEGVIGRKYELYRLDDTYDLSITDRGTLGKVLTLDLKPETVLLVRII